MFHSPKKVVWKNNNKKAIYLVFSFITKKLFMVNINTDMGKETLSEEILKEFFKDQIYEALDLEGVNNEALSNFARQRAGKMLDYLMDKAQKAEDGDEILQKAGEYGLNKDYLQRKITKGEYTQGYERKLKELLNTKNRIISAWVKEFLPALRSCASNEMTFDRDKDSYMNKKFHKEGDTPRTFDKLDNNTKKEVLLLKDFLDKLGLTQIYRNFTPQKTVKTRMGVDVNNPDMNKTTDFDDLGLDFSKLDDNELKEFYSSRRAKINAWAERVERINGEINNEILFAMERDAHKKNNKAVKYKKSKNEPNKFGDKNVSDLTEISYEYQIARRYLDRTYGMALDFGANNDIFKFGNSKIADDTLVVNFQAAMRCPAWNECIMKDACYAKVSEVNYDNTLNSNLKKGFIWEQTRSDNELMALMSSLIRACMINYQRAVQEYEKTLKPKKKKNNKQLELELNEGYSKFNIETSNKMCEMTFKDVLSEYGQEMLDLLSKHKNGTLIRLNENGDFIGQWLVDAWEALATDFKLVGINVAAYTCRALNYEKVKNMILNISQANLVRGQNSTAFAHYFYAITHQEYDSLGETYTGPETNYELQITKEGKIIPCYRNLVDENGQLCGYYYKCPCGRGKKEYTPKQESELTNKEKATAVKVNFIPSPIAGSEKVIIYNGQFYKLSDIDKEDSKVDCYRCRICYGRDEEKDIKYESGKKEEGLPVFVFVAVHGENAGIFSDESTHRKILGKDINYWINSLKNNTTKQEVTLNEEIVEPTENIGANDDIVMKEITNNMTMSVANMMRSRQTQLNEVKDNFNKILKNIQ